MKLIGRVSTIVWHLLQSGDGVSMSELLDAAYGDDPDGGPDNATSSMRVIVHRMRKKLRGEGNFRIVHRAKRYWLEYEQ